MNGDRFHFFPLQQKRLEEQTVVFQKKKQEMNKCQEEPSRAP